MISIILLVFAFVLAAIASWFATSPEPRPSWGGRLGWAALACYFLSLIIGDLGHITTR